MSRKNIEQENKMHQCHFNWAIIKFQKVYNNIWIEKEKILDEEINRYATYKNVKQNCHNKHNLLIDGH